MLKLAFAIFFVIEMSFFSFPLPIQIFLWSFYFTMSV